MTEYVYIILEFSTDHPGCGEYCGARKTADGAIQAAEERALSFGMKREDARPLEPDEVFSWYNSSMNIVVIKDLLVN